MATSTRAKQLILRYQDDMVLEYLKGVAKSGTEDMAVLLLDGDSHLGCFVADLFNISIMDTPPGQPKVVICSLALPEAIRLLDQLSDFYKAGFPAINMTLGKRLTDPIPKDEACGICFCEDSIQTFRIVVDEENRKNARRIVEDMVGNGQE